MKVAKVKRTINGKTPAKAEYTDLHFDLSDDRQVALMADDFALLAEGYYHNIFTSTNFGGFHLRLEVMVMARPLSNDPGDVHPAEFDLETWYVAFYPAGQDTA